MIVVDSARNHIQQVLSCTNHHLGLNPLTPTKPHALTPASRELAPKAMVLMNDVFGNYVIQKVLELGPEDHREELAQQMKGQVIGSKQTSATQASDV